MDSCNLSQFLNSAFITIAYFSPFSLIPFSLLCLSFVNFLPVSCTVKFHSSQSAFSASSVVTTLLPHLPEPITHLPLYQAFPHLFLQTHYCSNTSTHIDLGYFQHKETTLGHPHRHKKNHRTAVQVTPYLPPTVEELQTDQGLRRAT